uniref:Uncharacterized protein n=1 Tax=Acetobacter pasteurianus TaxID=438 RepID=A0A0S3JPM4_ACEPA|nr:hypothetical protein DB34_14405 [Acetobacter pasteurianus]
MSGRVCNGVNRYRLIIKPLEQARAAAVHYTQQLREALSRRKQAFLSKCQNDSEPHIQSNLFNAEPVSAAGMSHNDLIRWCESIGYRGIT